jgi:protein Tex
VDLNTASVELLRYVSGIQMGTAQSIIEFRTTSGGFQSRSQLMEVSGIGEKTFEQCAGFLRVRNGEQPLDATGIHPEAYPVVERMAGDLGVPVAELIGNHKLLDAADLSPFVNETIGLLVLNDIRQELLQPGRDPRAVFKVPRFIDGVYDVQDLEVGMEAEGVVTNITDFGAFVDIGVHQDGLIHLSELSNRYVRDPREIIKVGDIVRVKVIKVDKEIRRVSLSRKALLSPPRRPPQRKPATAAGEDGAKADQPHDGRHRPPRREGAASGEGREASRQRPSREGDAQHRERPRRSGGKSGQKQDRRPDRKQDHKQDTVSKGQKRDSNDLMNTQLAEQLAALRDKFSR